MDATWLPFHGISMSREDGTGQAPDFRILCSISFQSRAPNPANVHSWSIPIYLIDIVSLELILNGRELIFGRHYHRFDRKPMGTKSG
jgi:hypothetical protein